MATIRIKRRIKKKSKKKKNPVKIAGFVVLLVFFVGSAFVYGTIVNWTNNLARVDLGLSERELGIEPTIEAVQEDSDQVNIMIYGVDTQGYLDKNSNRSDIDMLVSYNSKAGTIKFISLLRETAVNIENHGEHPLKQAYYYGGPKLALQTVNNNFDLPIKEYVLIDFEGLVELIDYVGGLDIKLNEQDVDAINSSALKINDNYSIEDVEVGKVHLNGLQVLNYARYGSSYKYDLDRADRQKKVLYQVMKKVLSMDKREWPNLIKKFCESVETNATDHSMFEMMKLLYNGNVKVERYTVSNKSFDDLDMVDVMNDNQEFMWKIDRKKAGERIKETIYGK